MRHAVCRRALGLAVLAATLAGPRAEAQDFFVFPERAPNYASYERPSQCLAAVRRVRTTVYWGEDRDTLVRPRAGHPAIAEVARVCGGKFRAAPPPERDLYATHDLAVAMEDDSLLVATLRREVAALREPKERGALLHRTIAFDLLGGEPPREPGARRLIAWLDAMGDTLPEVRVHAAVSHVALIQHLLRAGDSAWRAEAAAGARLAWEIAGTLPEAQRPAMLFFVEPTLWSLKLPVLRQYGVDSMLASYRADVRSLVGANAVDSGRLAPRFATLGKPAPAITGDFWFGRPPGDSIVPRPGRVTLVQFVDAKCGISCQSLYATLRRLGRRFGDSLDIVLVTQTRGHLRDHLLTDPAMEAAALRDYFLGFQAVPGMLSVTTTPFTRFPDPDRRRVNGQVSNPGRYGLEQVVVDQRGRMLFQVTGQMGEPRLGEVIDALVKQPAATGATSAGGPGS